MLYQIAVDLIVLLHLAFIVFALAGGLLIFKWRWLIWLHIPAALWASVMVIMRWICPLTPIENKLRQAAGLEAYSNSFIEQYLIPVIYPQGLNRETFIAMGVVVIVINVVVYTILFIKRKRQADTKS
ncbi:MAG: DUF2784 domain-containing protein [Gammaproteobacteria bacterium]|nr:DUF2784 domain-containing protein [Gammaproteobacteria bacterium]